MRQAAIVLILSGVALAAARAQTPAPAPEPSLLPGLYAVFNTGKGKITAKLYDKYTPVAVRTFVGLAMGTQQWWDPEVKAAVKRPLYNNITFHRVVPGEMIQAGDPTGTSTHNCGLANRDEFLPGIRFDHGGMLAVANTGQPDTGACQFFITDGPVSPWNGKYTIFGEVVEGQDVVHAINHAPVRGEKPVDPVALQNVMIFRVAAPPKSKK